ncbi:alcohol dehydrogenase catalytic domain-containing protein [Sphingobacterium sp. NPDC055431]
MCQNHGVVYMGPGEVQVQEIDYPKLALGDRKCEHGVILKIVSTNICGSDQHMVRGRTTASAGLVLGHEITGQVVEKGRDVEFINVGDIVSVPFNIACGRCRNCKEGKTGICLNVNPSRPGAAYGYVDMGGWVGGQAEYVMVPYADFNLLKFPDNEQAMEYIRDLTMLSDIFPTGFHGAVSAGVGPGSVVYVAGAGGAIGIPGLYVTEDPGAVDGAAKQGNLKIRFGLGWAKSHCFHTGQCPVMKYHRQLMNAILYDKIKIADAVNVQVISLNEAPQGYADFDKGAARKYVIDPHGMIPA